MNDRFEGDELGISKEEPRSGSDGVRIIAPEEARSAVEAGLAEGHAVEIGEASTEAGTSESSASLGLLFPPSNESAHPTSSVRSITPPPRLVPLNEAAVPSETASEGVRIVGATTAGEATGEVAAVIATPVTTQSTSEEVALSLEGTEAGGLPQGLPQDLPQDLPHWSEPPTGEHAVIGAVDSTDAPRFRTGADDWDQVDDAIVVDDDFIDNEPGGFIATVPSDDDAAFAAEVEARRRVRSVNSQGGGARPAVVASAPADLTTRLITGAAIAVPALICFKLGRTTTALLVAVIVGLAALEFFDAIRKVGFRPATLIGVIASVAIIPIAFTRGEFAYPLVLSLVVSFSLLWFLFRAGPGRPLVGVCVTIGGFSYVGGLAGFAGLMLGYSNGIGLVIGLAICVIAYDSFGYLVGKKFGRTPLSPHVSPGKTLEGLVGGMAASIVVAVLVVSHIHPWGGIGHSLLLGLVVAVVAPIGDLCESMIKRDLRIKDFGSILPGHGGVLDRFDALLFVLPAGYFLARALKLG